MPALPSSSTPYVGAAPEIFSQISRVARLDYPLLLLGGRGTGKTLMARQIHALSGRTGRFVSKPVSWIPKGLEVGTLAGHKRGAFTGATDNEKGLIEQAHRGTLFLDELGDASLGLQSLLLEVLETRAITPVGAEDPRPVDVRIIAATNADLRQMAAKRKFRWDLLDRFGYFVFRVPDLAERREEIPALTDHFLRGMMAKLGISTPFEISLETARLLQQAPWPGNIRQLESVCEWGAICAHSEGELTIDVQHLPEDFLASLGVRVTPANQRRRATERALTQAGGNKSEAAKLLGISRTTIYNRLRNGHRPEKVGAPDDL